MSGCAGWRLEDGVPGRSVLDEEGCQDRLGFLLHPDQLAYPPGTSRRVPVHAPLAGTVPPSARDENRRLRDASHNIPYPQQAMCYDARRGLGMEKIGLDFSLLIAYLLPGAFAIVALSLESPTLQQFLTSDKGGPASSALIPLFVLALGLGIIINAITWMTVRRIITLTGVKEVKVAHRPSGESLETYRFIIENRFRYYQCYSNLFTALLILSVAYARARGFPDIEVSVVVAAVLVVLFWAARDSFEGTHSRIRDWMNHTPGAKP